MNIIFAPGNINTMVDSMEMYHEQVSKSVSGYIIGFKIRNVSVREIHRGYVCSDAKNDSAKESRSFIAQIIVLNHPGEIRASYTPVFDCHTVHIACKFDKLMEKLDQV